MPPMAGPPMLHTLPNMGVPPQCPPLSGVSPHRLRLLSGQLMLPHPHPLVWPHPLFILPLPRPHQVIGQLAKLSHLHQSNSSVRKLAFMPVKYKGKCDSKLYEAWPPVYLHLIFEISSVTRIFFNFEISSLKNWKINLILKLIFAGYTGSKNQVRTWKKNQVWFEIDFLLSL